jgi:hypothetical protein
MKFRYAPLISLPPQDKRWIEVEEILSRPNWYIDSTYGTAGHGLLHSTMLPTFVLQQREREREQSREREWRWTCKNCWTSIVSYCNQSNEIELETLPTSKQSFTFVVALFVVNKKVVSLIERVLLSFVPHLLIFAFKRRVLTQFTRT